MQGLLAGPEQLFGVVSLQRDVVREVAQEVGEDGEGLRGREGGVLACIANWTRQSAREEEEGQGGRGAEQSRGEAGRGRAGGGGTKPASEFGGSGAESLESLPESLEEGMVGRRVSAPRDLAPLAASVEGGREGARAGAEGGGIGGVGGRTGGRANGRASGCASERVCGGRVAIGVGAVAGVVERKTDPS